MNPRKLTLQKSLEKVSIAIIEIEVTSRRMNAITGMPKATSAVKGPHRNCLNAPEKEAEHRQHHSQEGKSGKNLHTPDR